MLSKQAKWASLQSRPTVAAHPQVQVDRTSRRDCGRKWVVWRRSILSNRTWWLGWRRRLLLGFLQRREERHSQIYVFQEIIQFQISKSYFLLLLLLQNVCWHGRKAHYWFLLKCKVISSYCVLTWVVGHRLLCSDRWKCCSSSWPIWVVVMSTLHFSDWCLWAPSLRPQVRSGTKLDRDLRGINSELLKYLLGTTRWQTHSTWKSEYLINILAISQCTSSIFKFIQGLKSPWPQHIT